MMFYLGAPKACWLERTEVPLFVAFHTLDGMKKLRPAHQKGRRAGDSGGFMRLLAHGSWDTLPADKYVNGWRRILREVGHFDWIAPRDWMCEPTMVKRTGLSVRAHQIRTVADLIELRMRAPEIPFAPVLQGWTLDQYLQCWDLYEMAGIHLQDEPIVGIGSVCRRQATSEAVAIFEMLAAQGLRGKMHGFGVKTAGLPAVASYLRSADSQARSMHARKRKILLPGHDKPGPGRPRGHKNCGNCLEYLLQEYHAMMGKVAARQHKQRTLWEIS